MSWERTLRWQKWVNFEKNNFTTLNQCACENQLNTCVLSFKRSFSHNSFWWGRQVPPGVFHWNFVQFYYRPQRSCGQGYVFTRVCDSVNRGGGGSPENPPPRDQGEPPPDQGEPPPDQADHPPQPGRPPPGTKENPPLCTRQTPFPGRTAAYGQWAAGTHPTGMHSCC